MVETEYLRLNWVPYRFQEAANAWIEQRRRQGIFWTPLFMCTGSGKSVVTLEDMMRAAERGARKFLVVCPLSVTGDWVDKAHDFNVPLRVARIKSEMTREARIRLLRSNTWDVLVINYASLRLIEKELVATKFDYIVFDEAQRLKNAKAKQTQAAREVSRDVKSRRGSRLALSGTPSPKNALDYWSIFDVLDPYSDTRIQEHHPLGLGDYRSFERLVSYKEPHPRLKGVFIVTFEEQMLELIKQRVGAHAFQVTKAEALPFLPPKREEKVFVDMTDVQRKLYEIMKEDAVLAIKGEKSQRIQAENVLPLADYLEQDGKFIRDREMLKQGLVTAKIQSVVMMRLHQITCGHVGLADGSFRTFDNGKIEFLNDNIEQWCDPFEDNKTIIFTAYRPSVPMLMEMAERCRVGAVSLTGDNSSKAQELVNKFQHDKGVRLFIINLAAGNSGLTLTSANRVCYFASSYNWEHRHQSEDRAHRIGQTKSVLYTDLMVRDSIEQYILKKLYQKEKMVQMTATSFVDMFK